MNNLYLLLLILLCIPLASAMDIVSGDVTTIKSIEKCQGPVLIKVTSEEGIYPGELRIDRCKNVTVNLWECTCKNRFDVTVQPDIKAFNMYDFTINYYLEYDARYLKPNQSVEIQLLKETHERTDKIIDVFTKEPKTLKSYFRIDMKANNIIMGVIGLLIILTIVLWNRLKEFLTSHNYKGKDSLNYAVNEEELTKMLEGLNK